MFLDSIIIIDSHYFPKLEKKIDEIIKILPNWEIPRCFT